MSLKCTLGFHSWNGCKCSICNKIRDEKHEWSKDCELCSECGQTRNEQHKWNGCICIVCNKNRDEQHDWTKDCEKCLICHKTKTNDSKGILCSCYKCSQPNQRVMDFIKECENGRLQNIELFINDSKKNGFNLNSKDKNGNTALMRVSYTGHISIATFLINKGAKIDLKNDDGVSSLMFAIMGKHNDIVKFLLGAGANINNKNTRSGFTALHYACTESDISLISQLINNGANVNLTDNEGNTPLHIACLQSDISTINLLINEVSNIDSINKKGETPLHCASSSNSFEKVNFLLKNGASTDLIDKYGCNPLWDVFRNINPSLEILKLIFEIEDIILINKRKKSRCGVAIYNAARFGHIETLKFFLDLDIGVEEINGKDDSGWNALSWAKSRKDEEMVKLLLAKGATD